MIDDRYAAGLFDGEGYVRISKLENREKTKVRNQIYAGLNVTFKPVIEALKETYGGSIHVNRHSLRKENHRDVFVWNVSSLNAAKFFRRIMPFLIIKREEVELALELQASIDEWRFKLGNKWAYHPDRDAVLAYRDDLRRRISELKHRTFSHEVGRGPEVSESSPTC